MTELEAARREGMQMMLDAALNIIQSDITYNMQEEMKHMQALPKLTNHPKEKNTQWLKLERHKSKAVCLTWLKAKIEEAGNLLKNGVENNAEAVAAEGDAPQ